MSESNNCATALISYGNQALIAICRRTLCRTKFGKPENILLDVVTNMYLRSLRISGDQETSL